MSINKINETKVFGGLHQRFTHQSSATQCEMTFAIFLPPQAEQHPVPVLYWLSGLTCTDENFMQKAGAFRKAAELGIAIVAPDTSPRGDSVPDDSDKAYDFGLGAGFYLNATEAPWKAHYQMYSYVVDELPALIESQFPVTHKKAISGHSMGGHGALTIGLKNQDKYQSISAFSPITNPTECPWGIKAFSNYLGNEQAQWQEYDACKLLAKHGCQLPILVDQGDADGFLEEQLKPNHLIDVAAQQQLDFELRMQAGYDHSYFFISSFIDDHLAFHAKHL
ncbi:S-formylglutathione hydrolase [Vibrio breoganii]|uniref:S-formylglutathione hydrolase n=1 Tax=Vibrio breoganii TaxID=553239 RepID=A0AAP8SVJ4_9VIBR|nr:S-formylglutathione hydrolase [Vibrio breoganii]NMO72200.1 S-formylglutathione hydrolase [Vibrio breoganii]NMR71262.1 S-formylglutathione hydrolase [Vibrio breoganii]PMG03748.1 S-formylglutathione hydrolase [Vibrio breoganii]PML85812.1 S-formylglutathione hydrolase [Vibrio breoganii]PMP05190.1 S-formylglutathione hydrolase [Vibrio breoganii]